MVALDRVLPRRWVAAVTLLATVGSTVPASAQSACDAATQERLRFLESRLEEGRTNASLWWRGWLATFAIGAVVQSSRTAFTDNHGREADFLFSAGKSLLGFAELTFRPIVAKDGADPAFAIPENSAEHCARRLSVAEATLARASEQEAERYSWTRHLSSLALNLTAGVLVAEVWHEQAVGWSSFGVSETFSELHIWSQPWRAIDDWNEYRERFDAREASPSASVPAQWRLAAGPRGLGVMWRF